jgi:hypothetical protein
MARLSPCHIATSPHCTIARPAIWQYHHMAQWQPGIMAKLSPCHIVTLHYCHIVEWPQCHIIEFRVRCRAGRSGRGRHQDARPYPKHCRVALGLRIGCEGLAGPAGKSKRTSSPDTVAVHVRVPYRDWDIAIWHNGSLASWRNCHYAILSHCPIHIERRQCPYHRSLVRHM